MGRSASHSRLPNSQNKRAEREHQRKQLALTTVKRDRDGDHDRAAQRDEDRSGSEGHAENTGGSAQARKQRRAIAPAPPQRHGALQADHGAEKSAHHQRPMQRSQFDDRRWKHPTQTHQPCRHPREQRDECKHQQGRAPGDRNVRAHRLPASAPAAAISGGLGDTHFPDFRAGLEVVPRECVAAFGLKMIKKRLGIVVVDQHKGVAPSKPVEGAENQRMAIARSDAAHVDGGWSYL